MLRFITIPKKKFEKSVNHLTYSSQILSKAEVYLQFTSRGVVETSFPLCLLVRVVDCFIGEKCLVVDGV